MVLPPVKKKDARLILIQQAFKDLRLVVNSIITSP